MQFEYFRTFAAAADMRSFTRAAELCSLSQPAVSQQIKELENYFGQPLFDRSTRNLTLTAAGERLRDHVAKLLSQMKAAQEDLDDIKGQPSGTLVVGAGNTIGMYLLPPILGEFRKSNPLVQLSIRIGTVNDLLQALHWKEVDVALVEQELPYARLKNLRQEPYADDEIVLIAPPDHPWTRRRIVPADLNTVPLLARQSDSPTRHLIVKTLAEAGVDSSRGLIQLEVGNTEALKRMVMAGLGLAFVSRYAIEQEVAFGLLKVVEVEGLSIWRKLWLLAPSGDSTPDRLTAFCDFIVGNPPKQVVAAPAGRGKGR